jgi:rubrerythrin
MNNSDKSEDILEPFRIARRLEEEGKAFFEEAARKAESQLVRQTFEFLATEEIKHIEKIERFYQSLEISEGKEVPDTEDSDAEQKLADFNKRLVGLKDEVKPSVSDVDAYEVALKFENGAEEFYEQKMNEADDPRIKRFYKWLIDEETMHARLLRSCLSFAEDPAAWFEKHR